MKRKIEETNRIEVTWNYNDMGDDKHWSIFNREDLFDFYNYFKEKMGTNNKGIAYVDYYDKKLSKKEHLTKCSSNNELLDFVGWLSDVGENFHTIGVRFELH